MRGAIATALRSGGVVVVGLLLLLVSGCLALAGPPMGAPAGMPTGAPISTGAPDPLVDETADVLYFWGDDCHTCHELRPFVEELGLKHPDLRFEFVEIYRNTTKMTRYYTMNRALNITPRGVPEAVVDGKAFFGEDGVRGGLPGAIRAMDVR